MSSPADGASAEPGVPGERRTGRADLHRGFEAVLFDLLTALLDSWSLWCRAAGSDQAGLRWRSRYLELTYGAGSYRPYQDLVIRSARETGLGDDPPERLLGSWDHLEPWPEARRVLRALDDRPLGVVTNCSEALGRRAAERLGVPFSVVVTAEAAGAYKPDPRPYRMALEALELEAGRVLFVAGSPHDIAGATGVGMSVFWHDRLGLAGGGPADGPLLVDDTLESLPGLLEGRRPSGPDP